MVGADPENASAHAFSNRNVEGRGSDAFTAPILQDIQEVEYLLWWRSYYPYSTVPSIIPCYSAPRSRLTLWPMDCSTPGFLFVTVSRSLLKLMPIELVMPSKHLIHCRPFFLQPSIFPSIGSFPISRLFPSIRWPMYWSFSFSISPSNEYSGLISFRIDSLALLAVQRTHKSLLQHHILKASILLQSAFFVVQLSHP